MMMKDCTMMLGARCQGQPGHQEQMSSPQETVFPENKPVQTANASESIGISEQEHIVALDLVTCSLIGNMQVDYSTMT